MGRGRSGILTQSEKQKKNNMKKISNYSYRERQNRQGYHRFQLPFWERPNVYVFVVVSAVVDKIV